MNSLIITKSTSLLEVASLVHKSDDAAKLRGKMDKDGNIVLYTSNKGEGTGLKNFLFGTVDKRRARAQQAIINVVNANPDKQSQVVANKLLGAYFLTGGELLAGTFKAISADSNLPYGMNVDEEGNLSGAQNITLVPIIPSEAISQMKGHDGRVLADVMNEAKSKALEKRIEMLGNHRVEKQALSDFFRFDYEIPRHDGTVYKSGKDKMEKSETVRNGHVADALRDFAESDAATTVLSSVLTQTTLSPLLSCLQDHNGQLPACLHWASSSNTANRKMSILTADGEHQEISDLKGLGAAKWKLSKQGADFKISIDLQMYAESTSPKDLPLHENGLIGVRFKFDLIVDGDEAAKGKLDLSIPNGIEATFSGRLSMNA